MGPQCVSLNSSPILSLALAKDGRQMWGLGLPHAYSFGPKVNEAELCSPRATQGLTSSLRVSESEPYFLPHMLRANLKLNIVALSRPESVSPRNLALSLSLKARLSSMGSSCPS